MERFWQASAGVMVAVVLWIILSKQGKEFSLGLSICTCCLVLMAVSGYLDPILDLFDRLEQIGNLQPEWIAVVLKAVGIGLIVEIGSLICTDAGNAALAKTFQIVGTVVILWLAVPLMTGLMDLVERILGEI